MRAFWWLLREYRWYNIYLLSTYHGPSTVLHVGMAHGSMCQLSALFLLTSFLIAFTSSVWNNNSSFPFTLVLKTGLSLSFLLLMQISALALHLQFSSSLSLFHVLQVSLNFENTKQMFSKNVMFSEENVLAYQNLLLHLEFLLFCLTAELFHRAHLIFLCPHSWMIGWLSKAVQQQIGWILHFVIIRILLGDFRLLLVVEAKLYYQLKSSAGKELELWTVTA